MNYIPFNKSYLYVHYKQCRDLGATDIEYKLFNDLTDEMMDKLKDQYEKDLKCHS